MKGQLKIVCLLLGIFHILSPAQEDISLRGISLEQGLPTPSIDTIFQDAAGFIWLGSPEGVYIYDGFSYLDVGDELGDVNLLQGGKVTAICQDKNDNIWIGTNIDLVRVNIHTREIRKFRNEKGFEFTGNAITDLCVDKKGILWVGTSRGLFCLDPDKVIAYRPDESAPLLRVTSIVQTMGGDIWVAFSMARFSRYAGGGNEAEFIELEAQITPRYLLKGVKQVTPSSLLFEDNSGRLWLGYGSIGLFRIDTETLKIELPDFDIREYTQINKRAITAINTDEKGHLVIGMNNGGGILHAHEGADSHYEIINSKAFPTHGIDVDFVKCIFKDRTGLLWIGCRNGGLTQLVTNKFVRHFPATTDNPSPNVFRICQDRQNNLWMAQLNGIKRRDGISGEYSWIYSVQGDRGEMVLFSIFYLEDYDEEHILIGGRQTGLLKLHKKTLKYTTLVPEITVRETKAISGGILAIASGQQGMYIYTCSTEKTEKIFPEYEGPLTHEDFVRCLEYDGKDILYFGTNNGLVEYSLSTGALQRYTPETTSDKLLGRAVYCLHYSKDNVLWVGTSAGLAKFDRNNNSLKSYSREDGLSSTIICGILESDSSIWISSHNGLSRLDKTSEEIYNFKTSDGLQSLSFNLRSCFQNSDGEMFFGGIRGYNSFFPETITEKEAPSFPVISRILTPEGDFLYPGDLLKEKGITLNQDERSFELQMTNIDYHPRNERKFRYILEGYMELWKEIPSENTIAFSNLNPGNYIFRVTTTNRNGQWGEEEISFRVFVTPTLFENGWFILVISAIAIIGVFMIFRIRTKYLAKQRDLLRTLVKEKTSLLEETNQALKEQRNTLIDQKSKLNVLTENLESFNRSVSHDLKSPIHQIRSFSQLLQDELSEEANEKQLHMVSRIIKSTDHMKTLIDALLNFSRSSYQEMDISEVNLSLMAVEAGQSLQHLQKDRVVNFHVEKDMTAFCDRALMKVVLGNLLGNAWKYTQNESAAEIYFGSTVTGGEKTYFIKDNGAGFDEEKAEKLFEPFTRLHSNAEFKGIGIGLSTVRRIIIRHHGRIWAVGRPGKGATFYFMLNANNND